MVARMRSCAGPVDDGRAVPAGGLPSEDGDSVRRAGCGADRNGGPNHHHRQEDDIAYNLTYKQTGADNDWRWQEQWLPHDTWYLLAVSSHGASK